MWKFTPHAYSREKNSIHSSNFVYPPQNIHPPPWSNQKIIAYAIGKVCHMFSVLVITAARSRRIDVHRDHKQPGGLCETVVGEGSEPEGLSHCEETP